MEKIQRACKNGDWEGFKKFIQDDKEALLEPFDLTGNTAIHKAAALDKPQLLREFLEMLSPRDRWHALRRKNNHQNTILHDEHLSVKIAEVVLECEKELPQPVESEIDEQEQAEKALPLLEIRNINGETPIYRAAFAGNLVLLEYLSNQVSHQVDSLKNHFHRTSDKFSILHAAVSAQHFEVALWLLKRDDTLADGKDDHGCTCLQLLCTMPSVFFSWRKFRTMQKFLYDIFPDHVCHGNHEDDDDDYDDNTNVHTPSRDIETGERKTKQHTSFFSRIKSAIWRGLAAEWEVIGITGKIKKKNKLAVQLANVLVSKDCSWQKSFAHKQRQTIISPAILSSNVSTLVKEIEPNRDKQYIKQTTRSYSVYTPLLLAAASGIVEIVEKILDLHPEAINHVSEDKLNILHVAVVYRQRAIWKIILKDPACVSLRNRLSANGNSLLHQVGTMKFFSRGNEAGIAYQLQEELRWFSRVRKILPKDLIIHSNDDNLTAEVLFNKEHAKMLKEAETWMKDTAQSCSTVAILVASVVYAAAYAVPGGNNEIGLPVFLGSSNFLFFTIMDAVAVWSSLASVVVFISILTSSFDITHFHKSLLRKLSLGFALLLLSLVATMLAFSTTILLTLKAENHWTLPLVYSAAALFPVAVFKSFQDLFHAVIRHLKKEIWTKILRPLPKCFRKHLQQKNNV